jgi:hypothetical protein
MRAKISVTLSGCIGSLSVERRKFEVLEPTENAALLATARGTRVFPIISLTLGTGLPRGEVVGLR